MFFMIFFKPCQKFITGLIVFCFFFSSLSPLPQARAQPFEIPGGEGSPSQIFFGERALASFVPLGIPQELASLEEIYIPQEGEKLISPIIYVQSVHSHSETQRKIYEILKFLDQKYGITRLFIEGAAEDLNPAYFRFFDENRLNVRVAERLLEKGELTGAELFLVESERKIPAYGLEEPDLYRANLSSFQTVMLQRPLTSTFMIQTRGILDRLQTLLLTPLARKLVRSNESFDSGQMELLSYVLELERKAKEILGLDLRHFENQLEWPQLIRLLMLQEIESGLDPEKIHSERQRLLEFMRELKLDPSLLGGFERLSFSPYQTGMVYDPGFRKGDLPRYLAERLVETTLEKGFSFDHYPAFTRFLEASVLQSEIDPERLFTEMEKLYQKLIEASSLKEEERKLVGLIQEEGLHERLFDLELTPKDFSKIASLAQTESGRPLVRFLLNIESLHEKTRLGPKKFVPANIEVLETVYGEAIRFYELAKEREETMVSKILEQTSAPSTAHQVPSQENHGAPVTVLITGGFHSDGLSRTFRKKRIPYTILSPRITEKVFNEAYVSSLLGEKKTAFDVQYLEPALKEISRAIRVRMTSDLEIVREIKTVLQAIIETAFTEKMPAERTVHVINQSLYAQDRQFDLKLNKKGDRAIVWDKVAGEPFRNANGSEIIIPIGTLKIEIPVLEPRSTPLSKEDLAKEFGVSLRQDKKPLLPPSRPTATPTIPFSQAPAVAARSEVRAAGDPAVRYEEAYADVKETLNKLFTNEITLEKAVEIYIKVIGDYRGGVYKDIPILEFFKNKKVWLDLLNNKLTSVVSVLDLKNQNKEAAGADEIIQSEGRISYALQLLKETIESKDAGRIKDIEGIETALKTYNFFSLFPHKILPEGDIATEIKNGILKIFEAKRGFARTGAREIQIPGTEGGYKYVYFKVRAPEGKATFDLELKGLFEGKVTVPVESKDWTEIGIKIKGDSLKYFAVSDPKGQVPIEVTDFVLSKDEKPRPNAQILTPRSEMRSLIKRLTEGEARDLAQKVGETLKAKELLIQELPLPDKKYQTTEFKEKLNGDASMGVTQIVRVGPLILVAIVDPEQVEDPNFSRDYFNAAYVRSRVAVLQKALGTLYTENSQNIYFVLPPIFSRFTQIAIASMIVNTEKFQDADVLDLGAGDGILARVALGLGASRVLLIERGEEEIAMAKTHEELSGIETARHILVKADLTQIDLEKLRTDHQLSETKPIVALVNMGPWFKDNQAGVGLALSFKPLQLLVNAGYSTSKAGHQAEYDKVTQRLTDAGFQLEHHEFVTPSRTFKTLVARPPEVRTGKFKKQYDINDREGNKIGTLRFDVDKNSGEEKAIFDFVNQAVPEGELSRWIEINLARAQDKRERRENLDKILSFSTFITTPAGNRIENNRFSHNDVPRDYFAAIEKAVSGIAALEKVQKETIGESDSRLARVKNLIAGRTVRITPSPKFVSLYFPSGKEIKLRINAENAPHQVNISFPFEENLAKLDAHQFVISVVPNPPKGRPAVSFKSYLQERKEGGGLVAQLEASAPSEPPIPVKANTAFEFEDREIEDGFVVGAEDILEALLEWHNSLSVANREDLLPIIQAFEDLFKRPSRKEPEQPPQTAPRAEVRVDKPDPIQPLSRLTSNIEKTFIDLQTIKSALNEGFALEIRVPIPGTMGALPDKELGKIPAEDLEDINQETYWHSYVFNFDKEDNLSIRLTSEFPLPPEAPTVWEFPVKNRELGNGILVVEPLIYVTNKPEINRVTKRIPNLKKEKDPLRKPLNRKAIKELKGILPEIKGGLFYVIFENLEDRDGFLIQRVISEDVLGPIQINYISIPLAGRSEVRSYENATERVQQGGSGQFAYEEFPPFETPEGSAWAELRRSLLPGADLAKNLKSQQILETAAGTIETGTFLPPVAAGGRLPAIAPFALNQLGTAFQDRPVKNPRIAVLVALEISKREGRPNPLMDIFLTEDSAVAKILMEVFKEAVEQGSGKGVRVEIVLNEAFSEKTRLGALMRKSADTPGSHTVVLDHRPEREELLAILLPALLNRNLFIEILFTPEAGVGAQEIQDLLKEARKLIPEEKERIVFVSSPDLLRFKKTLAETGRRLHTRMAKHVSVPSLLDPFIERHVVVSVQEGLWNESPEIGKSLDKKAQVILYAFETHDPNYIPYLGGEAILAAKLSQDALSLEQKRSLSPQGNRRYRVTGGSLAEFVASLQTALEGIKQIYASA